MSSYEVKRKQSFGKILLFILVFAIIAISVFVPISKDASCAASGKTTLIANFDFYKGSGNASTTYYFQANLLLKNAVSDGSMYIPEKKVALEFTMGSASMGGFYAYCDELTIELLSQSGGSDYSTKRAMETDHGANDQWNKGGGEFSFNVEEGEYKVHISGTGKRSLNGHLHTIDFTSETIYVDVTKPTLSSGTVGNNGYTSNDFTITATEKNFHEIHYQKNSEAYKFTTNNTITISSDNGDGKYTFYAVDKAGNRSADYYVILDTVNPTITTNGEYFNENQLVEVGVSDTNIKDYKITNIESGLTGDKTYAAKDLADGVYTITAYDKANNEASQTFTIDKTLPKIELSGGTTTDGGYAKTAVTVKFSDTNIEGATWKKGNGTAEPFDTGKSFSEDGVYTIVATDKAQNSRTYTFTIDTLDPIITTNGEYFKKEQSVKVSVSDTNLDYYEITNIAGTWTAETTFTVDNSLADGVYTVTAYDKAKRKSTKTFTIDKTLPEIKLSGGTTADGGYAKTAVTVKFSDTNIEGATWKKGNGTPAPFGTGKLFSEDGVYTIVATDKAKNSTMFTFTIDTILPEITLSGGTTANGGYAKVAVTVKFSDTNIEGATWKKDSGTATAFNTGTSFSEDGVYTIVAIDKAKNSRTYTFTIDTALPIVSCVVQSGGFTNANFTVSVEDKNFSKLYYKGAEGKAYSSTSSKSYTVDKASINGTYQFYGVDLAGNQSAVYTIYLDTEAPTLNSISNGGFYKGSITVSWRSECLLNSSDAITAKYSTLTSATFPTSAATTFTSGTEFKNDGNYFFRISDKAGNYTDYKVTIDNVAPLLTLYGVNGSNFSNTTVSASWATTVGGVGAARTNSNDEIVVTYGKSITGAFPTTANIEYTSKSQISEEGNYLFIITDKAGNSSSYQCTIDKVAPKLTLQGLLSGLTYNGSNASFSATWGTNVEGVGTQRMNNNDTLTARYSINNSKNTTAFPTSAATAYTRNTTLSDEGYYLMCLSDSAGNVSSYHIIIDKTAPDVSSVAEYLNYEFTYTASDIHNATIKYALNGGAERTNGVGTVNIALDVSNYGVWTFYAVDDFGNKSETQTVKLYYRDDFGNMDNIKNGYKVATWYIANLPSRIFANIAGSYSFTSRDSALDFAIAKEWEYRVEQLENGWSYVNISNESVYQIYTSRSDLDTAILKYASAYVSERRETQLGNNTYPNPTDGNGITRDDALTRQNMTYPSILANYANLPLFLIQHNYKFISPIAGVTGNTRKVQFQYIANDYMLFTGRNIEIPYDTAISEALEKEGANIQGYYLVSESDLCGNLQRYVVYLDNDMPTLNATATFGNGEQAAITFTNEFVQANVGVMLYVMLDLQMLFDNIDEFVMVCVSGRGMSDTVFVNGDELPVLTLENGYYGKYVINVYDRSMNYLSFEIRIAGETAYLSNTSLTNETRCTLTLNYDSSNNGITEIHIFKVSYLGDYTELTYDSDGTPISAVTLSYVLRTGGKYVVRFSDIFGRTVETDPLFYMKGLPSGSLKGVKEGGITNKDVSFDYYDGDAIYLYALINKEWVRYDSVLTMTEKEGYTIASITANEATSLIYKFFLYVENDMNLFVEYRFEIDCVAPMATITAENGDTIEEETVTSSSFSVTWDEANVTARYYNQNDVLGSFGETLYTKRTLITKAGTYVFTLNDQVGNVTSFKITLDNVVSYIIDGPYSMLEDGSYISKNNLVLTVTEHTKTFNCTSSNGISVMNGGTISEDGTYLFEIVDVCGNAITVIVIIDKLPPVPIIVTASGAMLEANGATNESFSVSCEEENVSIAIGRGTQNVGYNGDVLSDEGVYNFKMTDRMNNTLSFSVTIDKTVQFSVKGTYKELEDGSYISRHNFTVTVNEDFSAFVVKNENDITFLPEERIALEGVYYVTITDTVGNVANVTLILDYTAPVPIIIAEDGSVVTNGKVNKAFFVSCAESNYTLNIAASETSNGSVYNGEPLAESGVYYFRLSDLVGNEIAFTVEIDLVVDYTVNGIYKRTSDGAYISISGVSVTVKEEYSEFIVDSLANEFAPEEKITQEGTHTVKIKDLAGNEEVITIIIDKTAPSYEIVTVNDKEVGANEIINDGFIVTCQEDKADITFSMNGIKYNAYDGSVCSVAGTYYFEVSDFIGNTVSFAITIDLSIVYTVKGNYINNGNLYISRTGLSVETREDIMRFDVESSNGYAFGVGETVSREGSYTVTIADLAGNIAIIELVIDKTPPEALITTETGVVELNSKINESFSVSCEEEDVRITVSPNGTTYSDYDGTAFTESGTYYFVLSDRVGNESAFVVIIDVTVSFTVRGNYVNNGNVYSSRTDLAVVLQEDVKRFDVENADGYTFGADETVSLEGRYIVTIEDMAGNVAIIELVIDKTAPTPNVLTDEGTNVQIDSVSNRSFNVVVDEENAIITYSTNGINFTTYDGSVLSDERIYYFTATDYVGNSVSFTVTVDASVSYALKGVFNYDGDVIFSRTGVAIQVNEAYQAFTVNGESNVSVIEGARIELEGEYSVYISDMNGNDIEFLIIIDQTAPLITATVENGGKSADEVEISVEGARRAYFKDKAGETTEIEGSCTVEESGTYTVYAVDVAGNESTYKFVIDNDVDVQISPSLLSGQILTGSVNIKFSEKVTTILIKDGEEVSYTSLIKEVGSYSLTATDELGNNFTTEWVIVPSSANNYLITAPDDYQIFVAKDGNDYAVGVSVELKDNGNYSLVFSNGENEFALDLTVDTVAPEIEITQEKNQVVFSKANKDNVTYMLYRNGELVNCSPNSIITERGNYELIVTDALGNESVYYFELDYINVYGIVVIALGAVVALAVVIGVIVYRRKQSIK